MKQGIGMKFILVFGSIILESSKWTISNFLKIITNKCIDD